MLGLGEEGTRSCPQRLFLQELVELTTELKLPPVNLLPTVKQLSSQTISAHGNRNPLRHFRISNSGRNLTLGIQESW